MLTFFITIFIVNIFDHKPPINKDTETMIAKRKHRKLCVNSHGDDWRHSTLGSGCLFAHSHAAVFSDDNENPLCSVIVCYPSPPPPQTSVALSQGSKATTLPTLGIGSDLKSVPKRRKKNRSGDCAKVGIGSGIGGETGTGQRQQGQAVVLMT